MIVVESATQMSDQWFALKSGCPGSSSFGRIVTMKGEPSKQRKEYLYQLAGERLIGRQEPGYTSVAMQAGIDREAESRTYFELVTGLDVKQVGMVFKDETRRVLCSPDGLMEDCGLELKNPLLKTQVKYLDIGTLPSEYFQQVHGSMWVTGFDRWWFMSYFSGLDSLLIEVRRDDKFCTALDKEMPVFLAELDEMTEKLRGMR